MKRIMYFLLIGLLIVVGSVHAQDDKSLQEPEIVSYDTKHAGANTSVVYQVVEQMPEFPGGKEALMNFIRQNLKYPTVKEDTIERKVICRFIIAADGSVAHPEIIRSVAPEFDKQAIRIIKLLPKFIPGKQNGQNVNVWYTLSISFKIGKHQDQLIPNYNKSDSLITYVNTIDDPFEYRVFDGIYESVEYWPRFPGGDFALNSYINNNLQYPKTKDSIQGKMIMRFEVSKTGDIGKIEILKSLAPEFDQEAIRVIKNMPRWQPGKQNGENVNVWFTIPITFSLNSAKNKSANSIKTLEIYESLKQMPQFPGGQKELLSFVSKNLIYPASAKMKRIKGDVYVRFVVTETGKINDIEVIKHLSPDCDSEAIRLVKIMPNWIPGKLNGENVNVRYTISIDFKLD